MIEINLANVIYQTTHDVCGELTHVQRDYCVVSALEEVLHEAVEHRWRRQIGLLKLNIWWHELKYTTPKSYITRYLKLSENIVSLLGLLGWKIKYNSNIPFQVQLDWELTLYDKQFWFHENQHHCPQSNLPTNDARRYIKKSSNENIWYQK